MGYYTRYELKWEIPADWRGKPQCDHENPRGASYCSDCGKPTAPISPDEAIGDYIDARTDDEIGYCLTRSGDTCESGKWYEHENDMREMSNTFPGVLFTLSGEGAENSDIWKKYFLDGKMQVEEAQITIGAFDPGKLK